MRRDEKSRRFFVNFVVFHLILGCANIDGMTHERERVTVTLDERLVQVVPTERQIAYQQTEMYAFIHYTVNTYTDREWGDGTEDPAVFNPTELNADQWVETLKAAGMKGLILTCKHHDGFCLWPSKYTEHSVASSPYKGDVVKEVSDACRRAGLKFGVYLSPWDRNNPCYGKGKEYDDYFVNQLTELMTNYGELFSLWFDGACGEGPNGKVQTYDWDRYFALIRELQPNACINICGPDVRWCGNECADTRESEWSVVPERVRSIERIQENSQQSDNDEFKQREINTTDRDLGSRERLKDEPDLVWYPAEVDVSIRWGWFYHEEEDCTVRSPENLFDIYLNSVGGNCSLLLNVPPTKEGLLHEKDIAALKGLGEKLKKSFANNLLDYAEIFCDKEKPGFEIENVRSDSYETYFCTNDGDNSCTIEIKFKKKEKISFVVMKENIKCSQRIEKFKIEDGWNEIYSGTVVGYKKIAKMPEIVYTDTLKITIEDSRVCPTLSFLAVY